jgi:hypothetical protein
MMNQGVDDIARPPQKTPARVSRQPVQELPQTPSQQSPATVCNAHKKGGVVLSAYHATQGRRIVQTSIITTDAINGSWGWKEFSRNSRLIRPGQADRLGNGAASSGPSE